MKSFHHGYVAELFLWTWKNGESSSTGKVEAPFWSYKLAIQEGWAVIDPRPARGQCTSLVVTGNTFTGNLTFWQVGGAVLDKS
jgi:glucan 1,3-beta-glucosidase